MAWHPSLFFYRCSLDLLCLFAKRNMHIASLFREKGFGSKQNWSLFFGLGQDSTRWRTIRQKQSFLTPFFNNEVKAIMFGFCVCFDTHWLKINLTNPGCNTKLTHQCSICLTMVKREREREWMSDLLCNLCNFSSNTTIDGSWFFLHCSFLKMKGGWLLKKLLWNHTLFSGELLSF